MPLTGQPTLDALDDVPWSSLNHAYGTAGDVPDQIRTLLHPNPAVRQEALFTFTSNICHQGSLYPATVASIPFFVELLRYEGVEDREGILQLLGNLAWVDLEGQEDFDLRSLVKMANPFRRITQSDESDPEDEIEEGTVWRECYAEVAAGYPIYFELLEHSDARIAIAASFLIAFLPLHAFGAGPRLLEIARNDGLHRLVRGFHGVADLNRLRLRHPWVVCPLGN